MWVPTAAWGLTAAWAPGPPRVFATEARGGRSVALFIYLLGHHQVRGAPTGPRFLGRRRQPQAAYTSGESVELHTAKTRLGMGTAGQWAARNSAQTVGKEQTPSGTAGALLAACLLTVIAPSRQPILPC